MTDSKRLSHQVLKQLIRSPLFSATNSEVNIRISLVAGYCCGQNLRVSLLARLERKNAMQKLFEIIRTTIVGAKIYMHEYKLKTVTKLDKVEVMEFKTKGLFAFFQPFIIVAKLLVAVLFICGTLYAEWLLTMHYQTLIVPFFSSIGDGQVANFGWVVFTYLFAFASAIFTLLIPLFIFNGLRACHARGKAVCEGK